VLVLDVDPDEPRALKVLVADNEISRLAEIDDRALTEMLREIMHDAETSLEGTGFTAEQLAALAMITRSAEELADFDAAAEWVGMPEFDTADARIGMLIQFDSTEERARFCAEKGVEPHFQGEQRRVWSARWPTRERNDLVAVAFQ
jgi:hypothetical protein